MQHEKIRLQELRRAAAVPEYGNGGEDTGHLIVQRLWVDAVHRHKLRITRPAASGRAYSLRCSSFPHTNALRLRGGPIFPVLKIGNRMIVPGEKFVE